MPLLPVSDVAYVDAVAFSRYISSGRTMPMAVMCQYPNNDLMDEFVVKLYADIELGRHSCARELFGSLLGSCFGLKIPLAAIVKVSPEFCESILDNNAKRRFERSLGYNFGSKTIETNSQIFQYLPREKFQEAADIFAFDALIQNPDRRVGNPNMFQRPDGYYLFDHEMCFPYSRPDIMLGGFPDPWVFDDITSQYLRNHVLYKWIKHEAVSLDEFADKLASITIEMLDQIIIRMPDEWRTPEVENIKDYIMRASQNADRVKRGLQEVLA